MRTFWGPGRFAKLTGRLTRLAAVAALCGSLSVLILVQGRLSAVTAAVVDANWRGAYDILVTPAGQDFGADATAGLVDGNFVATSGGEPISVDVLDRIRALPEVDVAAPIGMVGVLRKLNLSPQLYITDNPVTGESVMSGGVQMYRITSTLAQKTPAGSSVVSRSQGVVAVRPLTPGDLTNVDIQPGDLALGSPMTDFAGQFTNFGFQIPMGALPAFGSTVIAVDPAAEQLLLNGRGAFLDPLSTTGERTVGDLSAGNPFPALLNGPRYSTQKSEIGFAIDDPGRARDQVVPLVVNTTAPNDLTLKVSIERSDRSPSAVPYDPQTWTAATQGTTFTPFNEVTTDVSGATVPFSSPDLTVLWPGSTLPAGEDPGLFSQTSTSLQPALIGRPAYTAHPAAGGGDQPVPQFTVTPAGIVGPDGLPPAAADPHFGLDPTAGLTQSYRNLGKATGPGFAAALPAPVGEFTTDDLAMPFNQVSYVPLGAYDANTTTLISTGTSVNPDAVLSGVGTAVPPSPSGLDFMTSPPGAFTDLAGGTALRGKTPIDAIRVRLSGITGYDQAAVQRVNAAAAAIASLGVTATVVAGSSPTPVAVYVPDYRTSGAPAADLGWVRQDWTTLGAVATVTTARDTLTSWLVGLGVAGSGAALIGAALLAGRLRRIEVGVLRLTGWTEKQVTGRLTRAEIPAAVAVAASAVLAVLLSRDRPLALTASISGVAIAAVAAAAAVIVARTTPTTAAAPRSGRTVLGSVPGLILRQAASSPWITAAKIIGPAIAGTAATAAIAVVYTSRRAAGHTRLERVS